MEYTITTKYGKYVRYAWTGGNDMPSDLKMYPEFRALRKAYFSESLAINLRYWGNTPLSVARILWHRAHADAWRTMQRNILHNLKVMPN